MDRGLSSQSSSLSQGSVLITCLQDGVGQVLSICFRLYCQNRGSPKVVSTAAATIRQAVALLFDHTVAEQPISPAGLGVPEGFASGREMAAMLLLQDLMNMCAGKMHMPLEKWMSATHRDTVAAAKYPRRTGKCKDKQ